MTAEASIVTAAHRAVAAETYGLPSLRSFAG